MPPGPVAETIMIDTPRGPARAQVSVPDAEAAAPGCARALVLGHGAGGGITAPDLLAARDAALRRGLTVALVEQPYRVAGRRSPPPAAALDEAWTAIVAELLAGPLAGRRLLCGGRSSGARVACRTALAVGAVGVLCLAFPLLAPARRDGTRPSRLSELEAAGVDVLVVQGATDRFGVPAPASGRRVVVVRGDHALRGDLAAVGDAVTAWLDDEPGEPR